MRQVAVARSAEVHRGQLAGSADVALSGTAFRFGESIHVQKELWPPYAIEV